MKKRFSSVCLLTILMSGCHASHAPRQTLDWSAFKPAGPSNTALSRLDVKLLLKSTGPTLGTVEGETNWLAGKKKTRLAAIVKDAGTGLGEGATTANSTLEIHGHSTRLATQKSYAIKLKKGVPLWHGVRKINLNKHPYDLSRMRNKLTFDLLGGLAEIHSLDTRFVRLTLDGRDDGLFTQVEEPNKPFLKARGLDEKGNLYKAERFEFERDPDLLKNSQDPAYDKAKFEKRLAIHGSKDHKALLSLLDDLNDTDQPINSVIDKHFDRKNYITWLAVNILVQNLDTNNQNFYLYRPRNSEKFVFIPWDYDGAWDWYDQPGAMPPDDPNAPTRWQTAGVANWWSVVLHRRFLEEPSNVLALSQRVDALATGFFTHDRLASLIEKYRPVVKAAIAHEPDFSNLPVKGDRLALWEKEVERLYTVVPSQQKRFHQTLDWPMPFFLGQVQSLGDSHTFAWNPSYSLDGDSLSYDFALSRSPTFEARDSVAQKTGLKDTSLNLEQRLAPGNYYWRIIARASKDPRNDWEFAFDKLLEDGRAYPGVAEFTVDSHGLG